MLYRTKQKWIAVLVVVLVLAALVMAVVTARRLYQQFNPAFETDAVLRPGATFVAGDPCPACNTSNADHPPDTSRIGLRIDFDKDGGSRH